MYYLTAPEGHRMAKGSAQGPAWLKSSCGPAACGLPAASPLAVIVGVSESPFSCCSFAVWPP